MPTYVGEEIMVTLVAKDFDHSTVLTPTSVAGAEVDAYDTTGTHLFNSVLTWDATKQEWFYLWDTTGVTAGTYRVKLTITALDGKKSWEYKRVRLARNPV